MCLFSVIVYYYLLASNRYSLGTVIMSAVAADLPSCRTH